MNKINSQFTTIEQITGQYLGKQRIRQTAQAEEKSFEEVLREKAEETSGIKFSKHAAMRLMDRNIQLSATQSERLEAGVSKAREKGIQESLVMVDSLAFIVNVPNKTVVTAIDQTETTENIFTNIDGAVIV